MGRSFSRINSRGSQRFPTTGREEAAVRRGEEETRGVGGEVDGGTVGMKAGGAEEVGEAIETGAAEVVVVVEEEEEEEEEEGGMASEGMEFSGIPSWKTRGGSCWRGARHKLPRSP